MSNYKGHITTETCTSVKDYISKIKIKQSELNEFDSRFHNKRIMKKETREKYEAILKNKTPTIIKDKNTYYLNQLGDLIYDAYCIKNNEYQKNIKQDYYIFSRGANDTAYKLVAGIYRNDNNKKSKEEFYCRELQIRCPNDIARLNRFNKLTYMQHYGASTRLLDITANPLVALFFACWDENNKNYEKDGKVTFFCVNSNDIKFESSDTVQLLSCLQEFVSDELEKIRILSYLRVFDDCFKIYKTIEKYEDKNIEKLFNYMFKENNSFQRIIKPIDLLRPVFVQPNKENVRLVKQEGAFIMSGLDYDEEDSEKKIGRYVIKEINIPSKNKKSILEELDGLCINEATLFPEFEHVAHYLKEKE